MNIIPTRPAPKPRACPECLRRGRLLAMLAPYIEKVTIEASGAPVGDLFCLGNEDLAHSVAPTVAKRLLGEVGAISERSLSDPIAATACWASCRHDPLYPESLGEAADAPWCLYGRGNPTLLADLAEPAAAVAVVGARRASSYGREVARTLGRDLAAAGITVISGMAFGIDACAHRGALEVGAHRRGSGLWPRRRLSGLAPLALAPNPGARPRPLGAAAGDRSLALDSSGPQPDHGGAGRNDSRGRGRRAIRLPTHRGDRREHGERGRRGSRPRQLTHLGWAQRPARRRRLAHPQRR